jgi:glycosyltransferase involved in cell wall biosynthesis
MTDIVHVISGLGTGGAESMLAQLAGALQRRGFSQHVVNLSARGAKADDIEAAGVPVTSLNLQAAPAAAWKLIRLITSAKPKVLQGWMYHGDVSATLAHYLAPGRRDRRLFWNIRASNMDSRRYGRLIRLNAWLSRFPDLVLANSQTGLDFHLAKGYQPYRTKVIPNGIDVDKFRPDPRKRRKARSEFGLKEGAVVAVHVARVDQMKDHKTFLSAMAMTPQVQGLMIGTDTERLDSPSNVRGLGVRSDLDQLYAAADAVVSSSAFGEGFSNVLAEGMSAGLVPISTDIGDARVILGDTGRFFPVQDSQALAKELAAFAALPATERRSRGLIARKRIEDNFTLAMAVDHFAELYIERPSPDRRIMTGAYQ